MPEKFNISLDRTGKCYKCGLSANRHTEATAHAFMDAGLPIVKLLPLGDFARQEVPFAYTPIHPEEALPAIAEVARVVGYLIGFLDASNGGGLVRPVDIADTAKLSDYAVWATLRALGRVFFECRTEYEGELGRVSGWVFHAPSASIEEFPVPLGLHCYPEVVEYFAGFSFRLMLDHFKDRALFAANIAVLIVSGNAFSLALEEAPDAL